MLTVTKDRSLLKITSIVMAVHGFLLICGIFMSAPKEIMKEVAPRRFVVQTITLEPSKESPLLVEETPLPLVEEERVEEAEIEEEIAMLEPAEVVPVIFELSKKPEEPKLLSPPKPIPKLVEKPKTPSSPAKKLEVPKKAEAPVKKPEPVKKVEKALKPVQKQETAPKSAINNPTPKATPAKKPEPVAPKKVATPPKEHVPVVDKAALERQKKKEAEEKAQKERQKELLAQAQERIAKIGQNSDKVSSSTAIDMSTTKIPTEITSLKIDEMPSGGGPQLSEREISYRDELASRLKLQLKLPEYGEVKIKLTVERSGKVVKVVVISAESLANRKHIEKVLPTLAFLPFESNFSSAQDHTFSVTLSNE